MRSRLVGLAALTTLVAASCGAATPDAGGPNEAIQVHGDWAIDVYDPDGSLDRSVEFSNAFVGANILNTVLTRTATMGPFNIIGYAQSSGVTPCETSCVVEADEEVVGDSVALSGSFTADRDGRIDIVETEMWTCEPSVAADSCTSAIATAGLNFTIKDVTTLDWDGDGTANDGPIPVADGQNVQIQVEISFTSG